MIYAAQSHEGVRPLKNWRPARGEEFMLQPDAQEIGSTAESMHPMQPPVCLAEEMGGCLGAGAVLFEPLPKRGQERHPAAQIEMN